MGRGRRKAADIADEPENTEADSGAVEKQDFELARRLYFKDIKPAVSGAGEKMQEASTAYKAIKKQANIDTGAAKLAFKLAEMEHGKQQHFLRSLTGMLEIMNVDLDADLVDQMNGEDPGAKVIPIRAGVAEPLPTMGGEDD